jgi:transposase-like protein/IS1 family transposase
MKKRSTEVIEKMDASKQFCPYLECKSRGQIGQGNIVIHQRSRPRYKCKTCERTFSAKAGTALEGIRKPEELFITVSSLLSQGCPIQAIVYTYHLDERTVAAWRDRAGRQCEKVHKAMIEQEKLDLKQVQIDEIRAKAKGSVLWIGLGIMVKTRLWIAGKVSKTRDRNLADQLLQQVYRCCKKWCAILICTDGWKPYPNSIRKAFREKVKETPGTGAPRKVIWPDLHIGTVIKRRVKMRLKEVDEQVTHGTEEMVQKLLTLSRGGSMINTSHIERFNGTMRERLASLTRKCRHASAKEEAFHTGMYLVGSVYNFSTAHHELSKSTTEWGFGWPCTPAMASGLTYHVWSVKDLLTYKVVPPPLPIMKKKVRSCNTKEHNQSVTKKRVVRLRKGVLCSTI